MENTGTPYRVNVNTFTIHPLIVIFLPTVKVNFQEPKISQRNIVKIFGKKQTANSSNLSAPVHHPVNGADTHQSRIHQVCALYFHPHLEEMSQMIKTFITSPTHTYSWALDVTRGYLEAMFAVQLVAEQDHWGSLTFCCFQIIRPHEVAIKASRGLPLQS